MEICRAFAAGAAFPALLMPFILLTFSDTGYETVSKLSFFHFLPFVWGVWNVFYVIILRNVLPEEKSTRLFFTGALLGFIVALYGVFVADIPLALGIVGNIKYLPLLLAPIIYALFWKFVVGYFNDSVGIHDN